MRILGITADTGVGYHRLMLPLVNMKKDYCFLTNNLNEEIIDNNYDIVVINRFLYGVDISELIKYRNKYGFKLVVDNDDHWNLQPNHILYNSYKYYGITDTIIEYMQEADLCTCTHERLAEEIYKYNPNVEILPNALPYGQGQFLDNKIESDKVRCFWSGSATHVNDIELVKNPFKRLKGMNVKMVMAGYTEGEEHWMRMVNSYTAGRHLDLTLYRYNDVYTYMAAYADSDISIIPLEENKFTSMKSNLKVLESAAKKIPCIVSAVNPYLNLPVHYVYKSTDWYKHIRELVYDKDARIESGNNLFEFCSKNYNFKEINAKRFDIYNNICNNKFHYQL